MVVEIPGIDRNDLANIFASLHFNVGAEIGVEKGLYSEILCKANPDLILYCVDPWLDYPDYEAAKNHKSFEGNYEETKRRLQPYGCALMRKKSSEAAEEFDPCELDFVYIDGNHQYEYVKEDLKLWSRNVRPGGIVAGHDYDKKEVKRAVDEFVDDYLFLVGKGKYASWFFIKS